MGVEDWIKPALPPFRKFKRKVFEEAYKIGQFIYQIGESDILRKPSKPVQFSDISSSNFQNKLKYLKNCLLRYRKLSGLGRGIAAVQVGIPEKFAIIYTPRGLITVINPKVTKISNEKNKYPEMCMSANPVIVPLIRPVWIEFAYLDENGNINTWTGKDAKLNRVFQHEIDHMEGIVNLDKGDPEEFVLHCDPNYYENADFEKI